MLRGRTHPGKCKVFLHVPVVVGRSGMSAGEPLSTIFRLFYYGTISIKLQVNGNSMKVFFPSIQGTSFPSLNTMQCMAVCCRMILWVILDHGAENKMLHGLSPAAVKKLWYCVRLQLCLLVLVLSVIKYTTKAHIWMLLLQLPPTMLVVEDSMMVISLNAKKSKLNFVEIVILGEMNGMILLATSHSTSVDCPCFSSGG